jgi:hypothetical protein
MIYIALISCKEEEKGIVEKSSAFILKENRKSALTLVIGRAAYAVR